MSQQKIAVISMSCRFPGVNSPEELWDLLLTGRSIFDGSKSQDEDSSSTILKGIEYFDAQEFGIGEQEAKLLDPQHRVVLELVREAIARTGYSPSELSGNVGVFIGVAESGYRRNHLDQNLDVKEQSDGLELALTNNADYLPMRISYLYNFKGPSLNVQSSCSTGALVAYSAMESLRSGDSDWAIAGAASIELYRRESIVTDDSGLLSPRGICSPFSESADGTVFSDGAGVLILKRLEDAIRDGDQVEAVICGGALNNDGSQKVGFTAPSVAQQIAVIERAYKKCGISPESIACVEAHATGTPLGDPIEVAALSDVYASAQTKKAACFLGSLKGNIGHTHVAAGMAAIIKSVLMLKNQTVVPTLPQEEPNPILGIQDTPFKLPKIAEPLKLRDGVLRTAVSSFGFGGTNLHLILERHHSYPQDAKNYLLRLHSDNAEQSDLSHSVQTQNLIGSLQAPTVIVTTGISTGTIRSSHLYSIAPTTQKYDSVLGKCENVTTRFAKTSLLFTGQGAQRCGMGEAWALYSPHYREALDQCCYILKAKHHIDIAPLLTLESQCSENEDILNNTRFAQPALFSVQYSLAKTLLRAGVTLGGMLGNSVGEYVAACLAGVFSLENALRFVAIRGELMQALPHGSMLAVFVAEASLPPGTLSLLDMAVEYGNELCVLSGENDAIARVEGLLETNGIEYTALPTSHAFHSRMLDPVIGPLTAELRAIPLQAPHLPFVSALTGDWIKAQEAQDPLYWARHVREKMNLAKAMRTLDASGDSLFINAGPGGAMLGLARQNRADSVIISPFSDGSIPNQVVGALSALGKVWCYGFDLGGDLWEMPRKRVRTTLPNLKKKKLWVAPAPQIEKSKGYHAPQLKPLSSRKDTDKPFAFIREWQEVPTLKIMAKSHDSCLVLQVGSDEFTTRSVAALQGCYLSTKVLLFANLPTLQAHLNEESKADSNQKILYESFAIVVASELWQENTSVFDCAKLLYSWTRVLFTCAQHRQLRGKKNVLWLLCSKANRALPSHLINEQVLHPLITVLNQEQERALYRGLILPEFAEEALLKEGILTFLQANPKQTYRLSTSGLSRLHYSRTVVKGSGEQVAPSSRNVVVLGGGQGLGIGACQLFSKESDRVFVLDDRFSDSIFSTSAKVIRRVVALNNHGEVSDAIQAFEREWGKIDCIVQAQKEYSEPIALLEEEHEDLLIRQLTRRVSGTELAISLADQFSAEKFLLLSSLSSALGGIGLAAYSMASAIQESIYQSKSTELKTAFRCVAVDAWLTGDPLEDQAITGNGTLSLCVISRERGNNFISEIFQSDSCAVHLVSRRELDREEPPTDSTQSYPTTMAIKEDPLVDTRSTIIEAWQDVLGVESSLASSQFFQSGGNSLLAARMISRLRKAFGIRLPLRAFLTNPTINGLTDYVVQSLSSFESSPLSEPLSALSCAAKEQRDVPIQGPSISQTSWGEIPKLGLAFFGNLGDQDASTSYDTLCDLVVEADQAGFHSAWFPERHFDAFGGLFPNPAVLASTLARQTKQIRLCAGSVVAPLQHTVRIAEDWTVIDQLSRGRTGIALASGWHPRDFVFSPESFETRKQSLSDTIQMLKKLWKGEHVSLAGVGNSCETLRIFPAGYVPVAPLWMSASLNPESFRLAASLGVGIYTHLLDQTVDELSKKIELYRAEWRRAGHSRDAGPITVMLHTYVAETEAEVENETRAAFKGYLKQFLGLTLPTLTNRDRMIEDEEDSDAVLDHAYDRYVTHSSLIGTPVTIEQRLQNLKLIGVAEVNCLVDFGVSPQALQRSFERLKGIVKRSRQTETSFSTGGVAHEG